ncbi:hypothetical protein GW781_07970 [bacterium]|nr:hypothetical protein [bacterium]NCT21077.1 hypothetical protein [bacterium]OIO87453.1 MAG: hypothetical protein AUK01_00070 [Anaerolineae bacterium CG2_30_57_67]
MKKTYLLTVALILTMLLLPLAPVSAAPQTTTVCNWAQFIADVSVPDGMAFQPGVSFVKTWRLKNIGSCTWGAGYNLAFVSGEQLSAPALVALPQAVAPGQTVDVSATMTAPAAQGTYRGYWQLKNASGVLFGIGSNANKSFWVEIKVSSGAPSATYDFAANVAAAQWSSGAGTLSFPGTDGDARGYVLKLNTPRLETGFTDSVPGLLTAPQNVNNGYIQGVYPAYTVQAGDRFQAVVGCEYGATSCYVNFRLMYQIGTATPQILWSFNERYEGYTYFANINLSSLAGNNVKFILWVGAAGSASGDRALWASPRIARVGPSVTVTPVTPTVTSTPGTVTVTPTPNTSCDRASFVADVTVPDGTNYPPSTAFLKTWRIKNVGTCTWNASYSLVFQSGDKMNGPDVTAFPGSVAPGQMVDLSANLTSPASNGTYRGYWILKNATGQIFGIGAGYNKPFWVDIQVSSLASLTPTPTLVLTVTPAPGTAYDFVSTACAAQWVSGAGVLPCPGADNDARGFVLVMGNAHLESGVTDGRASLLTFPQSGTNTYIQGIYPAFSVQTGDHFLATLGCEYGATACYVTYRLEYQIGSSPVQILWVFNERYEGLVYNTDIDLSSLAGQNVKFILTVLSAGASSSDRAVWVAPRIVRPLAATATPIPATATPSPTGPPTAIPTNTPIIPPTDTPSPTATP